MTGILLNPYKSFPLQESVIDDFIGSDGSSFNSSIWEHNGNTTHNALREISGNSLLISTGNTGGYSSNDSNCLRTLNNYDDPEIQFLDFEWLSSSVNHEMRIKFSICGSSYLDWYLDSSATALVLEVLPYPKTLQLWKVVGESWTSLTSTVSFATAVGSNPIAGTKWNVALRHTGTHFQAFVWDTTNSKPVSPTLSGSETTFTSGGKASIGCGNPASAVQRSFKVGKVLRVA